MGNKEMDGRVPLEPGSSSLRSPEPVPVSAFGDDPSRDEAALIRCIEALAFYAVPENWHGVYMVGCGPMGDDWSDVADQQYPDGKPGRLARETIDWLEKQYPSDTDGSGEAGQTAQQAGPEGREPGPQSGIAQTDSSSPLIRKEMREWLPIETAPTEYEYVEVVLLCREGKPRSVMPAVYDGFNWRSLSVAGMLEYVNPTHWQPLPDPPALSSNRGI